MPCYLCAEKSEEYPKPAVFKTPFMATAIPDFNDATDFLCPKCYMVYFRIIECRYGPKSVRPTSEEHSSGPPPPPPPPGPPPEPELDYTAYSRAYAPALVEYSLAAARSGIWDFEFLLRAALDELPSVSNRARPSGPPRAEPSAPSSSARPSVAPGAELFGPTPAPRAAPLPVSRDMPRVGLFSALSIEIPDYDEVESRPLKRKRDTV